MPAERGRMKREAAVMTDDALSGNGSLWSSLLSLSLSLSSPSPSPPPTWIPNQISSIVMQEDDGGTSSSSAFYTVR